MLAAATCLAQPTNKPTFIKGTMDIKFNSRTTPGALDSYTLNLNVSDSALFRGSITNTPIQTGAFDRVTRQASIAYNIDCDVVNPANPSQTRNVGRLYGRVPIEASGKYRFDTSTLKVSVVPIGRAQGFESKYGGVAEGRPIAGELGLLKSLKKEVQIISRKVGSKTVSVPVRKYDKMTFISHVIGAGPVQYYPAITVNGTMMYDYDRYCWFFQDVRIAYTEDSKPVEDKITGSIRWIEKPKSGTSREGEYQFDVRINEVPATASDVFAGSSDEAAFFQVDDSLTALTGAMKYKDVMQGDSPSSSLVSVELTGNKLTRQQCMNFAKLILLTCVVPLNAE